MATSDGRKDVDRLIAVTDGVFAIALTLLVLDVTNLTEITNAVQGASTDAADQLLSRFLWQVRPAVVSYAVSFMLIAGFWMAHRRIVAPVTHDDGGFGWISLVFLLLVAFLPFPTAVLGRFPNANSAVVHYDLLIVVTGVWLWVLAAYSHRWSNLVANRWTRRDLVWETLRILISPAVFGFSMLLAIWNLDLAKYVWIIAVLAYPAAGWLFAMRTS